MVVRFLVLGCILFGLACAGAPAGPTPADVVAEPEPAPVPEVAPEPEPEPAPEPPHGSEPGSGSAPPPAPPAEPAPVSDREAGLGRTFQPLADAFGFNRYVHVRRTGTGRGLVFEYLPEGESLDDWHYLGRLILTAVATTWEEGAEVLPRYIEAFTKRQREVNATETWTYPEGQVTFIDYEMGSGALHEHNLAAVWQVLPGTLAVFQAQRRPERFSTWQVNHFRGVAQRLGRMDAERR